MAYWSESHVPRPRTPPERITQEELHRYNAVQCIIHVSVLFDHTCIRRLLEQQEAEFQANLESVKGCRSMVTASAADTAEGTDEALHRTAGESES